MSTKRAMRRKFSVIATAAGVVVIAAVIVLRLVLFSEHITSGDCCVCVVVSGSELIVEACGRSAANRFVELDTS